MKRQIIMNMRPAGYCLSAAVLLALAGSGAEAGFLTKNLQICDQGRLLRRRRAEDDKICQLGDPVDELRADHRRPNVRGVPGARGCEEVAHHRCARLHPFGSLCQVDATRNGRLGTLFGAQQSRDLCGRSAGTRTLGKR